MTIDHIQPQESQEQIPMLKAELISQDTDTAVVRIISDIDGFIYPSASGDTSHVHVEDLNIVPVKANEPVEVKFKVVGFQSYDSVNATLRFYKDESDRDTKDALAQTTVRLKDATRDPNDNQ